MFLVDRQKVLTASCLLGCLPSASSQTYYTRPCPILNLAYPPPSLYASSDVIQSAVSALNDSIIQALSETTIYGQLNSEANAFSVDIYSLQDEEPLFNYHYTGAGLAAQYSVGVREVDSDTVYRIGSIGKALTVYTYLIGAGDETWNSPVTKFVPELAEYAERNQALLCEDSIDIVDWSSITVGALASQLSGIAREVLFSPAFEQALAGAFDLPPIARNESTYCGIGDVIRGPCDRAAFFNDFTKQRPFTAPFTTAIYSNVGFQILGYVIANITGVPVGELFNSTLVQRLNLNGTYYSVPPSPDTSIVPINTTASLWEYDARDETPTGGHYSSINDLRAIGKSILNFTLITPAQTRRWLRPQAFTADTNFSVGAPWEIVRAPGEPVSYIYSKTGAFGAYGGIIALMPEYKVGFSILSAGASPTEVSRILSDTIANILAPAVYNASQAAAVSTYAGTYTDSATNSTITISTPIAGPGLAVSEWTLNGSSFISIFGSFLGVNETTQTLSVSLYPSGLKSTNGTAGTRVSWRAAFRVNPQVLDPGAFSENCVTWGAVNAVTYGGFGFDEFVFTLSEDGTAMSIEPRVLGLDASRTSSNSTMPAKLRRSLS